jgi:hypothetical protein
LCLPSNPELQLYLLSLGNKPVALYLTIQRGRQAELLYEFKLLSKKKYFCKVYFLIRTIQCNGVYKFNVELD